MVMKEIVALMIVLAIMGWTIPKPMESVTNYNVLMIHGAYGSDKCFDLLTNYY